MGECVVFAIDGQQYAVEIAFVRESVQVTRMTPLPGLPPAFHGLANVRGQIIPVFDLRVLFNLDQSVHRSRETVLLLTHDSAEFGLLVDELLGPRAIALDRLQRDIAALHEQLLRGLSADGIIVLDVAALTKALTLDEPAA